MPANITSLPPEIMGLIHQHLMDSAGSTPTTEPTPPAQQHASLTTAQAARRAAAARAPFAGVSRQFNEVDRQNLSLRQNSAIGSLVSKHTIKYLAGRPAEVFKERLSALFQGNAHIEVDFATLSPKEATTVLRVLQDTVEGENGVPLHNVSFHVDLDHASRALLTDIDSTLTAIGKATNGKCATFEFACSSHNSARTEPPNFSRLANLTSVDLSECHELRAAPVFSNNPKLTSVNLSWCHGLRAAPVFSENPSLTSVDLSGCSLLAAAPDFKNNPHLTSVDLSGCARLAAAPDFKNNPNLTSVDLSWCHGLTAAPVFSENPSPTSVSVLGYGLPTAIVAALRNLLGARLNA